MRWIGVALAAVALTVDFAYAVDQQPLELVQSEVDRSARLKPLTIGEALRAAFNANPDLLDSRDLFLAARINQRGIMSLYQPQVTPFFTTLRDAESGLQAQAYGVTASQQFSFGPLLESSVVVTQAPRDSVLPAYASDYFITLSQPLLRGADPAVTREPLRLAERFTDSRGRALEIQARRTVMVIYQLYLALAREEQSVQLAANQMNRARRLAEFSRARFLAGSVSRLDVLRAEQQEASAIVTLNDSQTLVEDLRDQLRRAAGLRRDFTFTIASPSTLPVEEPPLATSAEGVADRRPEAFEAAEGIHDAQLAVRIAKSLQLPSLDGVLSYAAGGTGQNIGGTFTARNSAFLFGFRSRYGLNATQSYAQRRQAEIDLTIRERDFQVLEGDLLREVERAYRRLDAQRRNHDTAVQNLQAAELQAKVARLRFEKGLSDNFNVVDADNLLNSALLLELDSRLSILLAQLDCFYSSGYFNVNWFLQQP